MEFHRVKRERLPVPIIPLIDIMTILLIFFIVSSNFKEPRPVVPVDLPKVSKVPATELNDKRSVLAVSAEGKIGLEDVEVDPQDLAGHLKAFVKLNPNRKLELSIDEKCAFGTLVTVWEALTDSGIQLKDIPHRVRTDSEPQKKK